jgi:malonyl-CoA O-methyltransferase
MASTFFGPDTFLELHTCLNWIDSPVDAIPAAHFHARSFWEKHLQQDEFQLEMCQEVQFRKTYHNSQAVFQMAATLGYFQTMEEELSDDGNHLLHQWMKAYDQGFRTKDGNVYTTYHFIELIGSFL